MLGDFKSRPRASIQRLREIEKTYYYKEPGIPGTKFVAQEPKSKGYMGNLKSQQIE